MIRTMIFIDGTWLWHNIMAKDYGRLDFSKIINKSLTYIFPKGGYTLNGVIFSASQPINVDPVDAQFVDKKKVFFEALEKKCGFVLDIHDIDFHGRRLYKSKRSEEDTWKPKEKCVDISIASNIFYYAAKNEYDVAVIMTGDRDFLPTFRKINKLGKVVVLVSMGGSCSHKLSNEYPTLFLDTYLDQCSLE